MCHIYQNLPQKKNAWNTSSRLAAEDPYEKLQTWTFSASFSHLFRYFIFKVGFVFGYNGFGVKKLYLRAIFFPEIFLHKEIL